MLSIGDFSQLGQVSVRTLRLYDELGLLKPARVDRFSGYRYYSVEQAPRLNRILMLKELGLSLEQIADLLKNDMSIEQMHEMLTMKRVQIEQELQEGQARLARVEARLRQIEQEGRWENRDIALREVASQRIFSVRQVVPSIDVMYQYRCSLFGTLYRWLDRNLIEPDGLELAIYHNTAYEEQDIDMEAAVMTSSLPAESIILATPGDEVIIRELPGVHEAASIIHQGCPQDVGQAMVALYSWIGENDYSTTGPYREIHLYGKELELEASSPVTIELQIPVKKNPG
jgi:DNA-binding transcriptional MerR regulator